MRRRAVLTDVAVGLTSILAGCAGSADGRADEADSPATTDKTETPMTSDPTDEPDGNAGLVSGSLVPREECPKPGDATVQLEAESAAVRGCVVGRNGCTVPRLQDVTFDSETGVATVVVASFEERDENEACTEALVNLGYEAQVDTGGATLVGLKVVHDDVDGRRVVADVMR
ncbi:MAG: hypothetical protein ABEI27_08860 [Halobellus sp.]|uniref:hypothetical protein n=1 Tax=Halobellus sp. TaxID=1979212 RepID=UPI0035D4AD4D